MYLGQREFISCEGELDDIKGIAFVPEHVGDLKGNIHFSKKNYILYIIIFWSNFITGKFIFASLVVSFRHGREEDEIMGVSFKKDLVVDRVQVFPKGQDDKNNKLQVIHMKVNIQITNSCHIWVQNKNIIQYFTG